MKKEYTREEIEAVVYKITEETSKDLVSQFTTKYDELPDEQKNNPAFADVLAISIAQGNAARIISEALCELLTSE